MSDFDDEGPSLYTHDGQRKYLNRAERKRVLKVLRHLDRGRALCGMLLFWTGGRISEILAVRANSFQLDRSVVALRTLKRRRLHVREIPISPELMALFDRHFKLRKLQKNPATANQRLWPFHRVTAWRFIKSRMLEAGIVGRAACPRGMRHGFGVGTLQAGVPLSLVQRWMGHARMSTTAIYTEVSGEDEAAFAAGRIAARSSRSPLSPTGSLTARRRPSSATTACSTSCRRVSSSFRAPALPAIWPTRPRSLASPWLTTGRAARKRRFSFAFQSVCPFTHGCSIRRLSNYPLRSCMSRQNNEIGWLAKKYGNQELPLQVCRSAAGFYLGTLTPEGEPYSRESVQYWPTRESAEKALKAGYSAWTQKPTP